jgi:tetratricopeptide (TPR) repeat protein
MILRSIAALLVGGLLLGQTADVERAWKLAANGHRDEAIESLTKLVETGPADPRARLLLGSLLSEAGEHDRAIAQLTEAVRLQPRSAEAQNALGEAYSNSGDSRNARQPFERAAALDPGFGVAQLNLGRTLLAAREFDPAAKHLDLAIAILQHDSDAADAHYLRAKVYSAHDDAHGAAKELQIAVSIRPDFPEAWSDLGAARKTLLDPAGAMAAFQRAVQLAPGDAIAQYRLGLEYLNRHQAHLAIAPLQCADRISPDDQSTLNALQRALREDRRDDEAAGIRRRLAELLRKREVSAQNALAATRLNNEGARLEHTGDLHGAVEKYRAAMELSPESAPIRVNYAGGLLRLGQWTAGLNELHAALVMDPSDVKIKTALRDALKLAPAGTVPEWKPDPFSTATGK